MLAGDALVATGREIEPLSLALPAAVTVEDAAAAQEASPFADPAVHSYPECFVCGPAREPGDGLGIVCGPVPGRERELVAAPWEIPASEADAGGAVGDLMIWSALDCPGGIALSLVAEAGVSVLGRMAAQILAPVRAGATHVAIGWPIGRDGRKLEAGTAILSDHGEPLAIARATWIELRDEPSG